jgi:hypothetical protein
MIPAVRGNFHVGIYVQSDDTLGSAKLKPTGKDNHYQHYADTGSDQL